VNDGGSTWQPELDELRRREALAEQLGGADKVARQHEFGKLTVRERVEQLVDAGTFWEIGKTAGVARYGDDGTLLELTPSNFVYGLAELDGRPAIVSGDDFTVRGGSNDASISAKRTAAETMSLELRLPHVRLLDGMSGGGSVKTIEQAGRTYIPELPGWHTVIDHLNVAPSVSLVLGSVAGFGAARATTSHYSVIVRGTAQMMIAGPALVEQAGLGSVSKEELGHADIHSTNGAVDDAVGSEHEAFERALDFLSYLPSSVDELPPVEACDDPTDRRDQWLLSAIPRSPRQSYDMRAIVAAIVDHGSLFEIGRNWGTSVIGGLARLDGIPVAVYAENPAMYGGGWTADSCRKLIRLIDLASLFKLPIVHLEDCPGFLIGVEAERTCTVRYGSAVLVALRQAQVPYCTVVIRKAFGIAGASNRKPGSESMRMAWPSGDWGSLPLEGGLEVAYKADLAAADDPAGLKSEITERLNRLRSPHRSAEFYEIEQIIDPRDTRPMLCDWVRLARRTLQPAPPAWGFRP
jgi:acetyl-CoA carboxylase carboxyltransferase component